MAWSIIEIASQLSQLYKEERRREQMGEMVPLRLLSQPFN